MASLRLTQQALKDLAGIRNYSVENWGQLVAEEYLDEIEQALNLIRKNPKILRAKEHFCDSLLFYRVKKHYLACAVFDELVVVLTIKHGSMDLPNRLKELEPQLAAEAEALHKLMRK